MRASKSVPRMPTVAVLVYRRLLELCLVIEPVIRRSPPFSRFITMLSFLPACPMTNSSIFIALLGRSVMRVPSFSLTTAKPLVPVVSTSPCSTFEPAPSTRAASPGRCAAPAPRTNSTSPIAAVCAPAVPANTSRPATAQIATLFATMIKRKGWPHPADFALAIERICALLWLCMAFPFY